MHTYNKNCANNKNYTLGYFIRHTLNNGDTTWFILFELVGNRHNANVHFNYHTIYDDLTQQSKKA